MMWIMSTSPGFSISMLFHCCLKYSQSQKDGMKMVNIIWIIFFLCVYMLFAGRHGPRWHYGLARTPWNQGEWCFWYEHNKNFVCFVNVMIDLNGSPDLLYFDEKPAACWHSVKYVNPSKHGKIAKKKNHIFYYITFCFQGSSWKPRGARTERW